MTQFLCFYGDGPFRDNLVRAVAYPSGYSYFRPFRYRDEWVERGLLDLLKTQSAREDVLSESTVLAVRFFTPPHEWTLLPLRRVTITHVQSVPDHHLLYFTLGAFFDFRGEMNLEDSSRTIPTDEQESVGKSLFFRSAMEFRDDAFVDEAFEDEVWVRYADQLPKSNLPFKDDSQLAVFLKFQTPIRNGGSAPVGELYRATQTGPMHGTLLNEGSTYEFGYFHRTPGLIETQVSFDRFRIQHLSNTGNLELERLDEEASAHYQPHNIQLTALRRSGRGEELVLRPEPSNIRTEDDRELMTHDVLIPLRVKWSLWHRFKTRWLSLIALVAGFMLVNALDAAQEANTSVWTELPQTGPDGALGALVWVLQQRVSQR